MGQLFNRIPKKVPMVNTAYRCIQTEIPPSDSMELLDALERYEPKSMMGQVPLLWDRAKDWNVYDPYGNMWLDFSSGVVVANSGHANEAVMQAIQEEVKKPLLHTYCFPNKSRCELVSLLGEILPSPLEKIFLLSTGSEAAECALKLSRTYGKSKNADKIQIVTFDDAFHGRTLGSLQMGGSPAAKSWVKHLDLDIIQVPFPNAFLYEWANEDHPDFSPQACFDVFLSYLEKQGAQPHRMAAVMAETFQGGWVQLMPKGFVQCLRRFCDEHDILLIFDEIQAGFGRTGRMFGFEHYDTVPDLVLLGKGLSSSLPVSAVAGRADVMDLYGPNQMTSTHSGNPVTNAAALANIRTIIRQGLPQRALQLGEEVLRPGLLALKEKYPKHIGVINGVGMVFALIVMDTAKKRVDELLAHRIVQNAFEMGVLFFAPVGAGGTIKICPPLVIPKEALQEGMRVLEEAFEKALLETE